ncbi:MAG TPA: DUF938 domain-containing protein [Nannocystis exedens]|nr:DUF938 domain-containing protein [Nannocystis exedens]
MNDRRDPRRFAPATARNREFILAVLDRILPSAGVLLEIGAGSGEHAAYMAGRFPGIAWMPSDPDPEARASIDAWRDHVGAENVALALELDAAAERWPVDGPASSADGPGRFDAMLAINVVHISPWSTAVGLFRGAGRLLRPGGVLYLYGPYRIAGEHTARSNEAFDQSLKARDPRWGVRDLEALEKLASAAGLTLSERVPMPANNFSLVFRRP